MPICDKLGYERGGIRGIGQGYREMYGLESNIKNGGIPKRILLVTLRMMPVMLSSFSGTYRALIATVGKILGLCGVAGAVAASGVGKYILKDLRKFVGCSIVIPKYVMLCLFL